MGDITDFGSYMIEMTGATKHSVSFRKRGPGHVDP